MTDKIIIDGVDVSKCRFYVKSTHKLEFNNCGHICKDTECKYKRLWYKKQLTLLKSQYNALLKQNKSLQKELKYSQEILQAIANGTHFTDNIEEHLRLLAKKGIKQEVK